MLTFTANNIDIYYLANQNGGGMHFGQDYIKVISERYGGFNKVYEFCSGPGFIGFSLLGAGLANELVLSDLYEPLDAVIQTTIEKNNLEGKVHFYNIAGVAALPESGIDLVVSNPPHFLEKKEWLSHIDDRIYIDNNWKIHKEFYANIVSKLSDDGVILFQENAMGSSVEDFDVMIREAGLKVTASFPIESPVGKDKIYYIEAKKI